VDHNYSVVFAREAVAGAVDSESWVEALLIAVVQGGGGLGGLCQMGGSHMNAWAHSYRQAMSHLQKEV